MVKGYEPDRGDIVLLQFNPQAGREQAGRRPALVISPRSYNAKVGLALLCPITSQRKGYPFEVLLPENLTTHGVVLSDHVKSLDWRIREAHFVEKAPEGTLGEVLQKLSLLVH